ncbi:MAG: PAS domain-containing sensor histidine kinase [Syntrophomonadaceae bacterium]|nr:PAS domain-containing sensor histidine kinase [Syntrophomonadaceae bacterium]
MIKEQHLTERYIQELETKISRLERENARLQKTEEELRQSQHLIHQVFNSSPLPMFFMTVKDRKFIEANDVFLKRRNMTREQFLKESNLDWGHPEKDKFIELVTQRGAVTNYRTTVQRLSNEQRVVCLSGAAVKWQGEECVFIVGNDITELTEYQQGIAHLDQINLMGQMAGSIAHEIRNPLTSLRGFLQLFSLQHKYQEDKEDIELMIEEIDRINDIISAFLSLSRRNYIEPVPMNLTECITNMLQLIIADGVKNDVFVDTHFEDKCLIMIDQGEIRQLLLNLARNGIEAMPGGGTLTIRTWGADDKVILQVQDEGKGIPPEIIENIGTPFLTTKKNGAGLGMAVCFSIVERHNAELIFDTSPAGTSFNIMFPVYGQ